jgi:tetratricopeptide (TPR) repeat protein
LSRLEGDGLIRLAATLPELEYLFRHGLIKDAAYFSLVKGDRRALHRAAGEALEAALGNDAPNTAMPRERLPELAHHFGEAGEAPRALRYATLAGDAAAATYANAEAIGYYSAALTWAAQLMVTSEQLTHLYLRRGRALELSNDYPAALANYEALEAAGRQRGDAALELAGLIQRVVIYALPTPSYDAATAARLSAQALPLAQQLGDRRAEARLAWARMLTLNITGDHKEAVAYGEQALALARPLTDRELLATILTDLSRMYMTVGEPAPAEAALTEALSLWRALHNVPLLAESLTTRGGLEFYRGRYDQALKYLDEGLPLTRAIGNAWGTSYNLMYQSYILLDRGELGAALAAMQECVATAREAGFVYPMATIPATMAIVYAFAGDTEQAERVLQEARTVTDRYLPAETATVLLMSAWCHLILDDEAHAQAVAAQARVAMNWDDYMTANRFILALVEAELHLRAGRPERALARVNEHLRADEPFGTQAFITDLRRVEGEAHMALGQFDEAEQTLTAAYQQAGEQPSYRTLWTISAALARLAEMRGDPNGAARWRAESYAHRDFLAAHVPDAQQRAGFLALAERHAPTRPTPAP